MSSKDIWLWILLVMQPFNPQTNIILAECNNDAEKAAIMIRNGTTSLLTEKERRNAQTIRNSEIHRLMELCEKNDIQIITLDDEQYPFMLREIENPPIVLFVKGNINSINENVSLAVVGTRNCSKYSENITHSICGSLAQSGFVIVSGCALGVDAAAHRGTVDVGGKTIAVLGCGILVNYPPENEKLKKQILATDGALISELLPNTETFPAYYHQRNRIISGLSMGVLVVEAPNHSGSLITADYAIQHGRLLFCIPPHDISSEKYEGVVPLLRNGAIPTYGYIDILQEYSYLPYKVNYFTNYFTLAEQSDDESEDDSPNDEDFEQNESDSAAPEDEADILRPNAEIREEVLSSLEPNAQALLTLIAKTPQPLDFLVETANMPMIEISSILTDFELMGYVERLMDGTYTVTEEVCRR